MTQSTKLLFRLIRVRVTVGMAAAFCLFLLLALFQPSLDEEHGPVLLLASFGAVLLMGLNSLLRDMIFPITDRQLAWIPMAAWGLVSLAGAVGLLAGQVLMIADVEQIASYWFSAVQTGAPVLFILLLMWRGLRLNAGFAGFLGFFPAVVLSPGKGGLITPRVAELCLSGWPLWTLACIFLIWEAPRQMAVLRRLDYVEGGSGSLFKVRTLRLDGPVRLTWPTRLADLLTALLVLVLLSNFLVHIPSSPVELIRRNPFIIFFVFLLFLPIAFLTHCWRINRASGMRPLRALAMLMVEMTGIGYFLRDFMGVARGAYVRCAFCANWRMAWQSECLACGDSRPGISKQPGENQSAVRLLFSPHPRCDQGAFFFRVMVPIYLVMLIIAFNSSRWFGK